MSELARLASPAADRPDMKAEVKRRGRKPRPFKETSTKMNAQEAATSELRRGAEEDRERRYSELQRALGTVRVGLNGASSVTTKNGDEGFVTSKQHDYQDLVLRLRQIVSESLPAQATVLVVSKGDNELLKLGDRKAWHFPCTDDGGYLGHHPASSTAAIEHLENLRLKGADYLLFPSTAFWWLEFYVEFYRHLKTSYALIVREKEKCMIFALGRGKAQANAVESACRADVAQKLQTTLPSESDLRLELIQTLSSQGRIEEAHAILLEGLRHDPTNPRLLLKLVKHENSNGNQTAADQFAVDVLALAPNDYDVNFELAKIAWQRGRFEVVEERLARLVELFPSDVAAFSELMKFYCSRISEHAATTDKALLARFVAQVADAREMGRLPVEIHLRMVESLGAAGQIELALVSMKAALCRMDFSTQRLQEFVGNLLRPAVSDISLVPFKQSRALAAFLTHMGNGFHRVRNRFKAGICYQLAAAASVEMFAPDINLAFMAMADGNALRALELLSKPSRVYPDDAGQVSWPTWRGRPWPYSPFDLSNAFYPLKSPDVPWPKITVITPSFNQGAYVEETVLSVLNQHYPSLEYIVVDAGSTDGSVEILERYERNLTKLIIEPDDGQTDAINKGLRLATGELITWVNSDDMLGPGALFALAITYLDQQSDIIAGFCMEHIEHHFCLMNLPAATQATFNVPCLGDLFNYWLKGHYFYQPEVAFSRRILNRVGGSLCKELYYTMDYELWMRCAAAGARLSVIPWPVGLFRRHDDQKTINLDATVIEQGKVRDRFVVPQPGFYRKLDIRRRIQRALNRKMPEIAVVSTRADKIFSPDTARELRESFAADGLCVKFHGEADFSALAEVDLAILLVHLYKEQAPIRKLREAGCNVPILGWFWDNHHHVFENHKATAHLDIAIPGHAFAADYLRSRDSLMTSPVPLCVTQWTEAEARRFFDSYGRSHRSDQLYGGFVRYECAAKRNKLIQQLIDAGSEGVYFLDERDLRRYFGMSLEDRFRQWTSHKVSICLPLAGDLSQRLFDALLAGQIPLVPDDLYDLDCVIPPELQKQLPIVRISEYTSDAVADAHTRALRLFEKHGETGIVRRHEFALQRHMFPSRIRAIISILREFATLARKD